MCFYKAMKSGETAYLLLPSQRFTVDVCQKCEVHLLLRLRPKEGKFSRPMYVTALSFNIQFTVSSSRGHFMLLPEEVLPQDLAPKADVCCDPSVVSGHAAALPNRLQPKASSERDFPSQSDSSPHLAFISRVQTTYTLQTCFIWPRRRSQGTLSRLPKSYIMSGVQRGEGPFFLRSFIPRRPWSQPMNLTLPTSLIS